MRDFFRTLSILFFLSPFCNIFAQTKPASIPGEYHLQGVMETASAILLKPDSTFELYFSYGAMDRQGRGTWSFNQGKITLKCGPKPLVDFALTESKSTPDSLTTVKITAPNSQLLPHFEVTIRSNTGDHYGKTDSEGIFQIPKTAVASIELFFKFCPERYSTFPIQKTDNYFEFRVEPWIAEIFSDNIVLTFSKNGLVGQHPLLKGDSFIYSRAK